MSAQNSAWALRFPTPANNSMKRRKKKHLYPISLSYARFQFNRHFRFIWRHFIVNYFSIVLIKFDDIHIFVTHFFFYSALYLFSSLLSTIKWNDFKIVLHLHLHVHIIKKKKITPKANGIVYSFHQKRWHGITSD